MMAKIPNPIVVPVQLTGEGVVRLQEAAKTIDRWRPVIEAAVDLHAKMLRRIANGGTEPLMLHSLSAAVEALERADGE
jgi:hypothetical protein